MTRAKNSSVAEGPVSVQKVEKIEPVYYNNLVTRPSVFANPGVVTVVARPPPGAGVSVSGQKKVFKRALSEQEVINDYIATKKKQFAGEIPQGGTWYT
jgi:hypothetical protein